MRNIPRGGFSEILDNIHNDLKAKMIKYMFQDEADPESFWEDHVKTLITTIFYSQKVDFSEIRNSYYRKRKLNKKNWYNSLAKEVDRDKSSPIHEEAKSIQKVLEFHGNRPELARELYKGDPATFIQRRLGEVESWANDNGTNISEYPYLDSKTPYQLERAFEVDLIFIVCDFLYNSPDSWITVHPNEMINVTAVFHLSSNRFVRNNSNMMIEPDGETILFDQYKLSDDKLLLSIIRPNEKDQIMLDKMTWLDTKDRDIIDLVLDNRGERFYKEKKIIIDLRHLVKQVYNSESNRAYQLIKDRLKKINMFRIEGRVINKNKETYREFSFNFFQGVDIIKDVENGKVYAEIEFSDKLHQQYIDGQTVQIYSHLIKKLENPISRILIYAFQKERMEAHLENRPIRTFFDYNYFHDRIRSRSKKIESNLKIIESSLEEFKELHILINDFKRNGNGFDILLYHITDDEKADFFSPTAVQLIEG